MVANKKTRKNIESLCNDIIDLLTNLKIEDKKKKKQIDKIIIKSNYSKELINEKDIKKHNITGYNIFIKDCYNIKKKEKTTGILDI